MKNKFSFGIGCFHFGLKEQYPLKFNGSEYIRELRETLELISNVNNIEIYCDDDFKNFSVPITQELPNIHSGIGFFPMPSFMIIEFEVYIPFRIQSQLHPWKASFLETFTEKFKISINYTFHLPVTFVEPLDPSDEPTPSDAVVVVRKFLEHEFKNVKSDHIQFEFLGPSPFHADCYIYPEESDGKSEVDWKLKSEIFSQRGYDRMIFYFNPTQFMNAEEAKEKIFDEISNEIGFFYYIVQTEVEKAHDWGKIQNLINQLIFIQRSKGIKAFSTKIFTLSKLIDETLTSLAEFESEELYFDNTNQKDYRDLFSMREGCFQPYIDKEINNRIVYPTKEMSRLISFFESRRTKAVESLVVLIAAILAGGVGALLTILLTE